MKKIKNIKVKNEKLFKQYDIVLNLYNTRMIGLQNVLTIQSVYTSAAIFVLFSEFDLFNIITNDKAFTRGTLYAILVTAVISFFISFATLISFISQNRNCKELRKELNKLECQLSIKRLNNKNKLAVSIFASIAVLVLSTVVFLATTIIAIHLVIK